MFYGGPKVIVNLLMMLEKKGSENKSTLILTHVTLIRINRLRSST